jgi:F-type H+-transporting ATPase subunit gamma
LANLRDIKRRITSVQSTQKITSAMKMVSAAKLRRAQDAIENARPYAQRMRETLEEVAAGSPDAEHVLFDDRADNKTGRSLEVVVISSDRGLAGAFNSQVCKMVQRTLAAREGDYQRVSLTLVGKKAGEFFKRRRPSQIRLSQNIGAAVTYAEAQEIAKGLIERFENEDVDDVVLVYNEFVSTMTQTPRVVSLLPFAPPEDADGESEGEDKLPHDIEPSAESLLSTLVPRAVEVEVFRAMLENQAGEHAARMTAMESATKNTEELIESLTLQYNRARQAAITRELVEIVTGAQALE